MSSWRDRGAALLGALACAAAAAAPATGPYAGIGRAATDAEVAAWDIDVRPDFKGLPKGAGSVAQGMQVWESKCESCHGIFGESNKVFAPLVGGTTAEDVARGRVARLDDAGFPGRTTLMKAASVSTLWDYINRAMPWNAPKSLSTDEVYAVTAYLLNMGGVLPDSFVLSDSTIAQAQQRLPNRHGMSTDHGLWPGASLGNGGRPDVRAEACMRDCAGPPQVASSLPAFARHNHGNLAEQQRSIGPQRGAVTTRPPLASAAEAFARAPAAARAAAAGPAAPAAPAGGLALATQYTCTACHGVERRIVGPGFKEIAARYAARADVQDYLAGKIRAGGQGVWGPVPMPAQTLPDGDARALAAWLAAGAPH